MTTSNAEIVQAACNLHHAIRDAFFGEAQDIFDKATAFDPGDRVLDDDPRTGEEVTETRVTERQRTEPIDVGDVDKDGTPNTREDKIAKYNEIDSVLNGDRAGELTAFERDQLKRDFKALGEELFGDKGTAKQ